MNNDEIVKLSYALAVDLIARQSSTGQLTVEALGAKVNFLAERLRSTIKLAVIVKESK